MSARLAPLSALLAAVLAVTLLGPLRGAGTDPDQPGVDLLAASTNRPTPGNFTGYGFDQCLAPTQAKMDTWMEHSPFLAVGIYISGNSRACRDQPNLATPTWVSRQLARGWRLLPITLGPQASCSSRYPKYGARIDPTISPDATNDYARARAQGKLEAERAVAAAKAIGIVARSTLFYDLEAFDITVRSCKASAIRFVHGWSKRLHELGYKAGFYSSAASGIKMMDEVRRTNTGQFVLPDTLGIARWDGRANTSVSSEYLSSMVLAAGRPGQAVPGRPQRDVGRRDDQHRPQLPRPRHGQRRPSGDALRRHLGRHGRLHDHPAAQRDLHATRRAGRRPAAPARRRRKPEPPIDGHDPAILRRDDAPGKRSRGGFAASSTGWSRRDWMTLTSVGATPVLKIGSSGLYVRRAQRALSAAMPTRRIVVNGVYDATMAAHAGAYRRQVGMSSYNIVSTATWARLQAGRY